MKVIVAGYPKTGTKSLNAALTELGYNVYDYLESFWFHHKEWKQIYNGEGSTEDFKKMYENVDAVIDFPAVYFWEEIHKAFPDAKIILLVRDEKSWYKSFKNQMDIISANFASIGSLYTSLFIPTMRKFNAFTNKTVIEMTGRPRKRRIFGIFQTVHIDKLNAVFRYRRHNAYVLQKAPKDKLLVFNVTNGWEPLCKFLEKKNPSVPFPHENVGGKWISQNKKGHIVGEQIQKELYFSYFVILLVLVSIGYCVCFSNVFKWHHLFSTVVGFLMFIVLSKED